MWDKDLIREDRTRVDKYSATLTTFRRGKSQRWSVTAVYGPIDIGLLVECLDELDRIKVEIGMPWCMGGDFNEVLFSEERSNGNRRLGGMERLWDFLDRHNLWDVPLTSSQFTWSNFQDTPIV